LARTTTGPRAGARARGRIRLGSLGARRILLAYALVAPVVLWRFATSVYPFAYTAYLSFFDRSPVRRSFHFVGLGNYGALAQDPAAQNPVVFPGIFAAVPVSLQLAYGRASAELLNRRFPFRNVARAVNLLPWAMPAIVTGVAAVWIFNQ